jgi:hypothetical protein
MKFCRICERAIKKNITNNMVIYQCFCGNIEETSAVDVLISSETMSSNETTELYNNLIDLAPFDRSCQRVNMTCPNCGLNYMSQLRLGSSEIVVHVCKCGYKTVNN